MANNIKMSSDHQVLSLLEAVENVAEKLEQGRHTLHGEPGPDERAACYAQMLVDMERLNNLLHLVEQQPESALTQQTRQQITDTLDEVHERAARIATDLAIRRIGTLHRLAERAVETHEHPLGKSFQLRDDFNDSVNLLRALSNNLPQKHQDTLVQSATSINTLIERDRGESWLQPFTDEEPCALIDLNALKDLQGERRTG